jgi:exonuclease SbcC
MVPLKLSLKNFLSYGQTTQHIDFEPYNLICLSGKNGHGKSALLDALTWALWGHARKANTGARADENLVRLGQSQMMVCLEFMCNNIVYRVRRELTIASTKVQTSLDFGVVDPETSQIRGLTDKTIRATQEKITTTIGLDYESFINSVFLRQGYSNEFSKKSPKERKEILSSILGITQFELIKKRAIEKGRALATQKDTLLPIHQRLSCEIIQKEQLNQALADALVKEKELLEIQRELTAHLQVVEMQAQQHVHDMLVLQQTVQTQAKLQSRLEGGLHELRNSRKEFKKILAKKIKTSSPTFDNSEQLEKELQELQARELRYLALQQDALRITQTLQQHASHAQTAHTLTLHTHDMQLQQAQAHMQLHEKQARELEKKMALMEQDINKKMGAISAGSTTARYEKYREVYQKFVTHKNNLILKTQDCEYSLKKLASETVPECPTCKQTLDTHKKSLLCTQTQKDLARAQHQLRRFQKLLPTFKQIIIQLHAAIEMVKEIEHFQKQVAICMQEHNSITQELDREKNSVQELSTHKELLINQQKTLLEHDEQYQKHKRELEEITQQFSRIKISAEYKQELVQRIKLSKLDRDVTPETVNPLLQQIKKVVHVTVAHLKAIKNEHKELTHKINSLKEKIPTTGALEDAVRAARVSLQSRTADLNKLLSDIGSYKEQLSRLELQEKEFARLSATIQECSYQHELYQTIAHAVGKDGIQALLIEQALPEIEQEANNLLGKLTDNQAHLFIESLRDLKSGKSKETLDIHISDATGIRAYELFSGGEAFRIDFALRIALSKLLARRAGTSLQTLIIDEGFGSQDEEGLAHIMDALYKIQDDFAKIIIVSHLPYMKDQFPVHFVVNKTAQGSAIKVVEQG